MTKEVTVFKHHISATLKHQSLAITEVQPMLFSRNQTFSWPVHDFSSTTQLFPDPSL